jgi:hypothetical protein
MSWLPIAQAPQDATPVDIWSPTRGRCIDMRRQKINGKLMYNPVRAGPLFVTDATHFMIVLPPEQKA